MKEPPPPSQATPGGEDTARTPAEKAEEASFRPLVFRDWCKACGICSAFCPRGVIVRDATGAPLIANPERCIGCRFCELHCPDFAISVEERKRES